MPVCFREMSRNTQNFSTINYSATYVTSTDSNEKERISFLVNCMEDSGSELVKKIRSDALSSGSAGVFPTPTPSPMRKESSSQKESEDSVRQCGENLGDVADNIFGKYRKKADVRLKRLRERNNQLQRQIDQLESGDPMIFEKFDASIKALDEMISSISSIHEKFSARYFDLTKRNEKLASELEQKKFAYCLLNEKLTSMKAHRWEASSENLSQLLSEAGLLDHLEEYFSEEEWYLLREIIQLRAQNDLLRGGNHKLESKNEQTIEMIKKITELINSD